LPKVCGETVCGVSAVSVALRPLRPLSKCHVGTSVAAGGGGGGGSYELEPPELPHPVDANAKARIKVKLSEKKSI